ncbi:MAG: pyridoxal-phosphate dependent enzyme, partial [Pseudomonadota bacterium]
TYATASAGNHGLSVAAGARVFGAKAAIFVADTVPEDFARRLEDKGATVIRAGADYEAAMAAAAARAAEDGWRLLSDSSWPGYFDPPRRVMEGYLAMAAEAAEAMDGPPTHVLLQAGVGGMAAAVAAFVRRRWGDAPRVVVVEPEAAPALFASIEAGAPQTTTGPVSAMGRLDCKEPSLIALKGLARDADEFALIGEEEADAILAPLAAEGLATTPSGGAGLAPLLSTEARKALGLGDGARVFAVISEAPL